MNIRLWLVPLIAAAVSCGSPTGPERLAVTVQRVVLASVAEQNAWPFTPTVHGGAGVVIRGTALITCARPIGTATRLRGNLVEVHIAGDPGMTICPANVAGWQPIEATVTGLEPGRYGVRVTAVGHVGRAEWAVNVIEP
jgi:hypothetical protein